MALVGAFLYGFVYALHGIFLPSLCEDTVYGQC